MAEDKTGRETKAKETPAPKAKSAPQAPPQQAQAGDQPRIVWDSADMRSAYANVFNVAGAREEFVLVFRNESSLGCRSEGIEGSAYGSNRYEPICRKAAV